MTFEKSRYEGDIEERIESHSNILYARARNCVTKLILYLDNQNKSALDASHKFGEINKTGIF